MVGIIIAVPSRGCQDDIFVLKIRAIEGDAHFFADMHQRKTIGRMVP
jgi:hypothetical protein